jgi:hypothetical protein
MRPYGGLASKTAGLPRRFVRPAIVFGRCYFRPIKNKAFRPIRRVDLVIIIRR